MSLCFFFFFFNDTATTEIYTLSLHDALPISLNCSLWRERTKAFASSVQCSPSGCRAFRRSEEHTSELQSQSNLVCRLLLEKKKNTLNMIHSYWIALLRLVTRSWTRSCLYSNM